MNIRYSLSAWTVIHDRDKEPWPGWQEALDAQMSAYLEAWVKQQLPEPEAWQRDLISASLYPTLYRKATERQERLTADITVVTGRQHGRTFTLALLDEALHDSPTTDTVLDSTPTPDVPCRSTGSRMPAPAQGLPLPPKSSTGLHEGTEA